MHLPDQTDVRKHYTTVFVYSSHRSPLHGFSTLRSSRPGPAEFLTGAQKKRHEEVLAGPGRWNSWVLYNLKQWLLWGLICLCLSADMGTGVKRNTSKQLYDQIPHPAAVQQNLSVQKHLNHDLRESKTDSPTKCCQSNEWLFTFPSLHLGIHSLAF